MKPNSRRQAGCSKAAGLTLIEVVASVALLSSLLVTTLSIRARHIRQINYAFEKNQAVELLDLQVADWFESEDGFPIGQNGNFPANDDFRWQVFSVPVDSSNPTWQLEAVRIDVTSNKSEKSVVSLELLDFFDRRRGVGQ